MSDDRDDQSEALDGDVLGEEPWDADPPGLAGYPPERSLGVEDPSLEADDDVEMRAVLRRGVDDETVERRHLSLVDPAPEGALDHEAELVGDTADPVDEQPAEEAAIHIVDDGSR